MPMRPKTTGRALPPRMLARTKTLKSGKVWTGYYYNGRTDDGKRVEIPLGTDLDEAKRKWADLECKPTPADIGTMHTVFDRYARNIVPTKAPRTQRDNMKQLVYLRKVFDQAPIDAITTAHLAQYRDARGKKSPVQANRELALFSHAFNMAREWGYTSHANPARGLRKNKETPRAFYADDDVYGAVLAHADQELRDTMQLAYFTGQRPADVLKMRWAHIQDGALEVQQNKTAKRLRIAVQGELLALLDSIRARRVVGPFIASTMRGQGITVSMLRSRFDNARNLAKAARPDIADKLAKFQFRDIRPKAASEIELQHAQTLLGHGSSALTERVYRRKGQVVGPTK
jgi:integrase